MSNDKSVCMIGKCWAGKKNCCHSCDKLKKCEENLQVIEEGYLCDRKSASGCPDRK